MPSLPGLPSRAERIRGAVLGHLVGDALGVPYEFHEPDALPQRVTMTPPAGFPRAHASVPPGTWSDDGAHMLALLDSLVTCGRLDPDDLARRFVAWYERGAYAVGQQVFDVGIQTGRAILALRAGAPALAAGASDERANGNGSLMRVLPLGLWHRGSDAALCADAADSSRITHAHVRSLVCCQVYSLWVRRLLDGADTASGFEDAVAAFRAVHGARSAEVAEFETRVMPADATYTLGGSGYVVDTFRAAVLLNRDGCSYEEVVRAAIALGHDTDTTACVAGGIAGLVHGVGAIPDLWLAALREADVASGLVERLLNGRHAA
ncbi:ADP-ribosylglycohydrolase family protein [Propioniciclava sinopodophylli]|uniref:ADP-ribosylglycohydrolase family protein n=1 Tax=Propioniciclava sinopodophylli TaxID=1837344 RepID=UPI002492199C|nr:ADP-ribosylglycohydrolase family protein [Propioniciclava sinopodophylli]